MKKHRNLFGALFLVCYMFTLYQISFFCRTGLVRSRLPFLVIGVIGTGISFFLWLFSEKAKRRVLFWLGWIFFLAGTVYFGARIVHSAIPYNGALSWKIDQWTREKKVTLKHTNFLESGIQGILTDLDGALNLPEDLYISNEFKVSFDKTGEIQSINTFLYGKTEGGKEKTYLVDYQGNGKITVWVNGEVQGTYDEDMRLAPMLELLENAPWKEQKEFWDGLYENPVYEMLYCGRRSFASQAGLQYVEGDADGDGTEEGSSDFSQLLAGGEFVGFELSFHIPEREEVTPVRYMMEPEYISQDVITQEHQEEQIQEAQEAEGWTVDQEDGTMYYFLDGTSGWALDVEDAAAGSRFYILRKSIDGGNTWETINKDPFLGEIGVAEGLLFFDENLGFAGLTGASQTSSQMYLTKDGGATFSQITLPMDQVTQLPESAAEYGLTIENYNYKNMPKRDGEDFTILVTSQAGEQEGIRFRSRDDGETWTYDGE